MDLAKLKDPFPAADIEWRVAQCGKNDRGIWAKVLAYVTNRAIMDRLDEVCSPSGWRNEFATSPAGGVLCGISIFVGGEWITKWDGADNTEIEAVKGGLSGAMKRAGVQWGIGRYLYNLEEGWAVISDNGAHNGKTKENVWFRWDPPSLAPWALPGGSGKPDGASPPRQSAPKADEAPRKAASVSDDVPPCPVCEGPMWDNRTTKKGKQPDLKCKSKECDTAIWLDGLAEDVRKLANEAASGGVMSQEDRDKVIRVAVDTLNPSKLLLSKASIEKLLLEAQGAA